MYFQYNVHSSKSLWLLSSVLFMFSIVRHGLTIACKRTLQKNSTELSCSIELVNEASCQCDIQSACLFLDSL